MLWYDFLYNDNRDEGELYYHWCKNTLAVSIWFFHLVVEKGLTLAHLNARVLIHQLLLLQEKDALYLIDIIKWF